MVFRDGLKTSTAGKVLNTTLPGNLITEFLFGHIWPESTETEMKIQSYWPESSQIWLDLGPNWLESEVKVLFYYGSSNSQFLSQPL